MAKSEYNGEFGPKMIELLKYLGMNLNALHKATGHNYSVLRGYKDGKREPSWSLFRDLLILIPKLNSDWFFFEDPSMIKESETEQKKVTITSLELSFQLNETLLKNKELHEQVQQLKRFQNGLIVSLERIGQLLSETTTEMAISPNKLEDYESFK